MVARLEHDVLAQRPDLVLWQLGSNGVIRGLPVDGMENAVRAGINRIKAAGAEVVLIDLQHAPRIDEGVSRDQVLDMIRRVSRDTGVALFHRYRLMRAWDQQLGVAYRGMVHEDRLHMTDLSYRCMAHELAVSLDRNTASLDQPRN